MDSPFLPGSVSGLQVLTDLPTPLGDQLFAAHENTHRSIYNNRKVYNPVDYGAVGDGATDNTAVIQDMIDTIGNAGGTLLFPPGHFLFNILINDDNDNLAIIGAGHCVNDTNKGTVFSPYDRTVQTMIIGDTGGRADHLIFRDFNINGWGVTDTTHIADGLLIQGTGWTTFDNVFVSNFRGNNILVTSTATSEVFYLKFNNLWSSWAEKASIKLDFGGSYVTSVYINGFFAQSNNTPGTSYLIDNNDCLLHISQAYCDHASGCGVIIRAGNGKIKFDQVILDRNSAGTVGIEVLNCTSTQTLARAISGQWEMGTSTVKYSDGVEIQWSDNGVGGNLDYQTHMPGCIIDGNIALGDTEAPNKAANTLPYLFSGAGSPETRYSAPVGSLYLRTDGSTSTTLYIKTSGTGNTGWTAK